ncbi:MAG TPA: plasmid maintenance protein CcdB [Campylobacterales bacterium]|nr:plasmid maintenance protein CcdB [Campylobacterales bacterium]
MVQFDVYKNLNEATNKTFPYLLNVQNDLLSSMTTRVVVPLALGIEPIRHLNPTFTIEGQSLVMSTAEMAGISLAECSDFVVNLKENRNEIIDALDFLVNGF